VNPYLIGAYLTLFSSHTTHLKSKQLGGAPLYI